MQNKVIITLSENEYKKILHSLVGVEYNVKILPNESALVDDEVYQQFKKNYRKTFDDLNKYIFEKTTNK